MYFLIYYCTRYLFRLQKTKVCYFKKAAQANCLIAIYDDDVTVVLFNTIAHTYLNLVLTVLAKFQRSLCSTEKQEYTNLLEPKASMMIGLI